MTHEKEEEEENDLFLDDCLTFASSSSRILQLGSSKREQKKEKTFSVK